MRVGLDIGCSLTKIALLKPGGELTFSSLPSGNWSQDASALEPVIDELQQAGVADICVTGAGAEPFVRAAQKRFRKVLVPPGDAIEREIHTQAEGVQSLMANQGTPLDEFMLVSVGSGVSFTLVSPSGVRQYMPGLSAGGLYIANQSALVGVAAEDIGRVAEKGEDSDLLMRHVFPGTRFPRGEFVVGSYGRLGSHVDTTPENICYGHLKYVATAIAGHLLDIKQNPDWAWSGKVVYIGTPVSEYQPLRDNLQMFTLGLGMDAIFVDSGRFACALGALRSVTANTAIMLPPAGRWGRLKAFMVRKAVLAKVVLAKLTARKS